MPQALPIAVPAALLCGILFGLGGRAIALFVRRAIVVIAILGSLFSFVMFNVVIPNVPAGDQTIELIVDGVPNAQGLLITIGQ